eukprot:98301-Rhodomonas_salina.2
MPGHLGARVRIANLEHLSEESARWKLASEERGRQQNQALASANAEAKGRRGAEMECATEAARRHDAWCEWLALEGDEADADVDGVGLSWRRLSPV